jgi:hypothetical protein
MEEEKVSETSGIFSVSMQVIAGEYFIAFGHCENFRFYTFLA